MQSSNRAALEGARAEIRAIAAEFTRAAEPIVKDALERRLDDVLGRQRDRVGTLKPQAVEALRAATAAAIEAGAADYLLKAAPQAEIVAGIRSVAAGQSALSPQVAVRLVERMRRPEPSAVLTPRELDVLRLVSSGRSNKQIATALGIGESTVKTHLLRVFEKLGVADRTRAVTRAMELGLL